MRPLQTVYQLNAPLLKIDKVNYVSNIKFLPDNVHIAKLIIDRGANVNINSESGTPLHAAVRANCGNFFSPIFRDHLHSKIICVQKFQTTLDNEQIIELLLKNGANATIVDSESNTPLHLAVAYGEHQKLNSANKSSFMLIEDEITVSFF